MIHYMASFLGRVAESIFNQLLKVGIIRVFRRKRKKNERREDSKEETDKQKQKTVSEPNGKKIHPWRLCPCSGILTVTILLNLNLILFTGCQTAKVFEMKSVGAHELSVIKVARERVIQDCHSMNARDENKWRHQYRLHVLNENSEVISLYHPINQDADTCNAQLKKIEKVLKNAKTVKICARDILEKDDHKYPHSELYDFGPLGKHKTPYSGLTFDTICNEKNNCFSISETWIHTCPGFSSAKKSR